MDLGYGKPGSVLHPAHPLRSLHLYYAEVHDVGSAEQRRTGRKHQKIMLYTMPLIIGVTAMSMPAGVCLYWVVQNIFSFFQQFFMMRKLMEKLDPKEVEQVCGLRI